MRAPMILPGPPINAPIMDLMGREGDFFYFLEKKTPRYNEVALGLMVLAGRK